MSNLHKKILITELYDGLINQTILWFYSLFGYEIILFCKTDKEIKLTKYKLNDYSSLKHYDFSIFFHRKGEWVEKLYKEIFFYKKIDAKDKDESTKFRILVKDVLQRSIGSFDEIMYLAELNQHHFTKVKVRCRWNIAKTQVLKKYSFPNNIVVNFSILSYVYSSLLKLISLNILKKIINRVAPKPNPIIANEKHSSEVIFFPHKGINYGDSFEKDYYYSDLKSSPLNRNNLLHLEYGPFDPLIAKSYLDKNLDFSFLNKPKALDLIKFVLFNPNLKIKKTFQNIITNNLSIMQILLFIYIETVSRFLVEFYVEKLASITGAKFALLGYDILFPKEISVALHRLNICTIAIQERYAIVYAGNYNVVVDQYFVWSYSVENMINESIGESYVGSYFVTGPPRSDKIKKYTVDLIKNPRKKFIVYSNSPEPRLRNSHTVLNNWVNILPLLSDVYELSNKFPECDFIIRAKHTGWDEIEYFASILKKLSLKENVLISSNYKEMDVSYSLLSGAYGILGHHTSIADEGMFRNIPVLFHDFCPFADSIYAEDYRYEGLEIFSKSSDDFQMKFENYFIKGIYPEEFNLYLEKTFGSLRSGSVTERIGCSIQEIVSGQK